MGKKLTINNIYKFNEEQEVMESPDYSYWICIGEKEDHYILHELEGYAKNNDMDVKAFYKRLEETSSPDEYITLEEPNFVKYNSLEAIYYKKDMQDKKKKSQNNESLNKFQVV